MEPSGATPPAAAGRWPARRGLWPTPQQARRPEPPTFRPSSRPSVPVVTRRAGWRLPPWSRGRVGPSATERPTAVITSPACQLWPAARMDVGQTHSPWSCASTERSIPPPEWPHAGRRQDESISVGQLPRLCANALPGRLGRWSRTDARQDAQRVDWRRSRPRVYSCARVAQTYTPLGLDRSRTAGHRGGHARLRTVRRCQGDECDRQVQQVDVLGTPSAAPRSRRRRRRRSSSPGRPCRRWVGSQPRATSPLYASKERAPAKK